MTLYRYVPLGDDPVPMLMSMDLLREERVGVWVPVAPCEHGNTGGHVVGGRTWVLTTVDNDPVWCEGEPAGKRGEEIVGTPFEQSIIQDVEDGELSDRDGLAILGYEGDG